MNTELLEQFPELTKSSCEKKKYVCGHCMTARTVANGTGFYVDGVKLSTEDAIRYNLRQCKGSVMHEERPTVREIRREGHRILKAGVNVRVQLKRKAGTRRSDGYVVECYDNETVKVFVEDLGTSKVVPVDEFLLARQGSKSR